jgi:RNA polymerase sigma-70 factor (ECF subfamily)
MNTLMSISFRSRTGLDPVFVLCDEVTPGDVTSRRRVTDAKVDPSRTTEGNANRMDEDPIYEELRGVMFSMAYRMIGGVSEAEDIVQEAFLRFHRASKESEIESPKAYLSTVTTRLAIDHLRSARVRRETYVGPWIPEPLLADTAPDAGEHAEIADSLSLAFLVVLERLSPVERAVFLLHDVFEYGYEEIAEIVGKSADNCRQLAVRARRHVEERRARFDVSRARKEELTRRFFAACEEGDTDGLIQLLADDVVFYGDGGGKGRGLPQPVNGRDNVRRLLLGFFETRRQIDARLEFTTVNAQPGVVVFDADDRLINVIALDIVDGIVSAIYSVINPDKLTHLGHPLSDFARPDRPQRYA